MPMFFSYFRFTGADTLDHPAKRFRAVDVADYSSVLRYPCKLCGLGKIHLRTGHLDKVGTALLRGDLPIFCTVFVVHFHLAAGVSGVVANDFHDYAKSLYAGGK